MELNLKDEYISLQYPFSYSEHFIPEFITKMRASDECIEKPSPRQSLSMYKLLFSTYLKKGYLSFQDFVEIAIVTSRIENQELAEKVAVEILLSYQEEKRLSPEGEPIPMPLLSPKSKEPMNIVPGEKEEKEAEPQARLNAEADIFKEFTKQPDLGVGPGENELLKAYMRSMKKSDDERTRRILAQILKEMLLKMGRKFEKKEESLFNPVLRPFERGEDPEQIDEEGSLENIFDQGRKIEEIRYQDFLMRKREKRKKTIIYIQDISNTMFYELDGLNSIQYSILSLIPLMWALRRERYGLILFESNSHILKEIFEYKDETQLIDALLMLVTSTTTELEKDIGGTKISQYWGGTIPNTSLKWGFEKLDEIRDRSEKICFFFSDFALEEPGTEQPDKLENYKIMEEMIKRGIHIVACVSPLAYSELFTVYTEPVLSRIKKLGCHIVDTNRPSEFLQEIQTLLEIF
jgi:hypothetical protein